MPGSDRTKLSEEGPLASVLEPAPKEASQDSLVEGPGLWEGRQNGLRFGGEGQQFVALIDVERLDPKAISAEQEAPGLLVPQRQRPHSIEATKGVLSPASVRLEDDLGVALAAKADARLLQLGAQLKVVVELAVVAEGQPRLFQAHGLSGQRAQVDNRQAPVAEGQWT